MFFYWGFGTQIFNLPQMFIRCTNVRLTSSAPNKKYCQTAVICRYLLK